MLERLESVRDFCVGSVPEENDVMGVTVGLVGLVSCRFEPLTVGVRITVRRVISRAKE